MNLIQQLQTSPKWKEFEEWYSKQYYILDNPANDLCFALELKQPFEKWKGVFEKFIESQGSKVICLPTNSGELEYGLYWKGYVVGRNDNSFGELLIWYFNN